MDVCPLRELAARKESSSSSPLPSLLVWQLLPSAGLLQVRLAECIHGGFLVSWHAIGPVRQGTLEWRLAALGPSHRRIRVPMHDKEVAVLHGNGARLLVLGLQLAPRRPPDGTLQVARRGEELGKENNVRTGRGKGMEVGGISCLLLHSLSHNWLATQPNETHLHKCRAECGTVHFWLSALDGTAQCAMSQC